MKDTDKNGVKFDTGKAEVGLISSVFIMGLSKVLTFGAGKYSAHNWRKGIVYSKLFNALMRHLWAWWGGENEDDETGMSHLDHAACCLMFLRELSQTRLDLDDRYIIPNVSTAKITLTSEQQQRMRGNLNKCKLELELKQTTFNIGDIVFLRARLMMMTGGHALIEYNTTQMYVDPHDIIKEVKQ